jgi:hypothetical protein
MNIQTTRRAATLPGRALTTTHSSQNNSTTQEPAQADKDCGCGSMSTADKFETGGVLLSLGGLATSMGTFAAYEAGWVAAGSSAEMWGGLGGMAAFVGGAAIAGIAVLASRGE